MSLLLVAMPFAPSSFSKTENGVSSCHRSGSGILCKGHLLSFWSLEWLKRITNWRSGVLASVCLMFLSSDLERKVVPQVTKGKKLLGAPGIATRSKNATRNKGSQRKATDLSEVVEDLLLYSIQLVNATFAIMDDGILQPKVFLFGRCFIKPIKVDLLGRQDLRSIEQSMPAPENAMSIQRHHMQKASLLSL